MFAGNPGLGDPECGVNHGGGIDLHGYGVGIGGVEAVEMQDFLEIEDHALDSPAHRIQFQRFLGGEIVGIQDVAQKLSVDFPLTEQNQPELDGRLSNPASYRHLPFLDDGAPASLPAADQTVFLDLEMMVQTEEPPQLSLGQFPEESNAGIEAIPQNQSVDGNSIQQTFGSEQFRFGRIGIEQHVAADASDQIVSNQQAARQNHRSFVPKNLATVGDFVQSRSIDRPDPGKPFQQRVRLRHINSGSLRNYLLGKRLIQRLEETIMRRFPFLEERHKTAVHPWDQHILAQSHFFQPLGQAGWGVKNDGHPESSQNKQTPFPLPFPIPDRLENAVAQDFGDMFVKNLQRIQKIDLDAGSLRDRKRIQRFLRHRVNTSLPPSSRLGDSATRPLQYNSFLPSSVKFITMKLS